MRLNEYRYARNASTYNTMWCKLQNPVMSLVLLSFYSTLVSAVLLFSERWFSSHYCESCNQAGKLHRYDNFIHSLTTKHRLIREII